MSRILDALPMIGSFLIVILVLFGAWYFTRWYARRMGSPVGGKSIRIVDRASLSNTSTLLIVAVDGKYYLLGASDHTVSLLCELPDFEEPSVLPMTSLSFQGILDKMLRKAPEPDKNNKDDGETQ